VKILVINTGSSTIKFSLFDMENETELAGGMLEKIGEDQARLSYSSAGGQATEEKMAVPDHGAGMDRIVEVLTCPGSGALEDKGQIDAVAHRVVHGGESFHDPVLIDETVVQAIRENIPLAPLHNPANLAGIEKSLAIFPAKPQAAVFDTAFHLTMPRRAFLYCLPIEVYEKYRVRRYGFHGTSHHYVTKRAAEYIGIPVDEINLVTLHLGNGASATAVRNGRSIDTSMGLTPLEGLCMGTRCGDLDPAILFYLAKNTGLDLASLDDMLNRDSGLKGLAGTNDMREVIEGVEAGDARAELALDMYAYRIRKYIGAYCAALGRVDAVVFTGGIGENSPMVREMSCKGLDAMGIEVERSRNELSGDGIFEISAESSSVKIIVVPTNEALEIARRTLEIVPAAGQ